jgi:hypothetical protein
MITHPGHHILQGNRHIRLDLQRQAIRDITGVEISSIGDHHGSILARSTCDDKIGAGKSLKVKSSIVKQQAENEKMLYRKIFGSRIWQQLPGFKINTIFAKNFCIKSR